MAHRRAVVVAAPCGNTWTDRQTDRWTSINTQTDRGPMAHRRAVVVAAPCGNICAEAANTRRVAPGAIDGVEDGHLAQYLRVVEFVHDEDEVKVDDVDDLVKDARTARRQRQAHLPRHLAGVVLAPVR
jgi:hypothetical protein